MIEKPVNVFLNDLSSSSATPGGGSAAALIGSMGAALVSMVANLTKGKKKYESVEKEVLNVLDESELLRVSLQTAIQSDVEAFNNVMAAYSLPKETDEEKTIRSSKIQNALRNAIDAPMECAKLSARVIPLCKTIAKIGNVNIISDAGVAVLAARAAFKSAELNVYVNASGLKDREFAESKIEEVRRLSRVIDLVENETFSFVADVILK
ncbi:MAG: methenyltetrahydrofolate cyclohydrolase [Betaproteobacteria bacterium TMED156]|nr:MAG: methenyltetrahydrofolate cyclohydrolase [Betaproteobacteria bacterium TMED156]|tara:strand:+ start:535 stop:1161 length:627 start_codon:yes stop_codon:yes gene_type:complete